MANREACPYAVAVLHLPVSVRHVASRSCRKSGTVVASQRFFGGIGMVREQRDDLVAV